LPLGFLPSSLSSLFLRPLSLSRLLPHLSFCHTLLWWLTQVCFQTRERLRKQLTTYKPLKPDWWWIIKFGKIIWFPLEQKDLILINLNCESWLRSTHP
jgi:hypothetical protein